MPDKAIKLIFERREGKIPGASVVDGLSAEGFFEFGEAVPGVFGVIGSGDAPKIKGSETEVFSVEDDLDEENDASVDFALGVAGGGMSIKTGGFVVINQGGGEGLMV